MSINEIEKRINMYINEVVSRGRRCEDVTCAVKYLTLFQVLSRLMMEITMIKIMSLGKYDDKFIEKYNTVLDMIENMIQ